MECITENSITEKGDEQIIQTGLGEFSKDKFDALIKVRETALKGLREALEQRDCSEVTTSTLVNIAGSCENPHASFTLNFYGRLAHLSQSAQLQLEALVIRLKRAFYTIHTSFREEHYEDPQTKGRKLSEFTLVESEKPYPKKSPKKALDSIMEEQEFVIKHATKKVLKNCSKEIALLEGDANYLKRVVSAPFNKVTYEKALELLNSKGSNYQFGVDLGIKEERIILEHFNNIPTFVTYHPASIKFFNMKRTPDGKKCYSVDLLMPKLGETIGGAVREEDGGRIKKYLLASTIGKFLREKGQNPLAPFAEYFNLFMQEKPLLRGGYGIGFERFVGFLLQSNDILNTISYRTLKP